MPLLTDDDLRNVLREMAKHAGGQNALARNLQFSTAFISDVLNGRRQVSDKLAAALGYARVPRFVKIRGRDS